MLELLEMLVHNNVVQALILVAILWLIAKDEANLNLGNMCALLFFSFAIGWASVIFLFPHIGIFGIVAKPIIFILLIKLMCWVRYRIAFAATAIYVVISLLLNIALFFGYFLQKSKAEGGNEDLVTFAQDYISDQFAGKEDRDADELYADEPCLEQEMQEPAVEMDNEKMKAGKKHAAVAAAIPPPRPAAVDKELGLDRAKADPKAAVPGAEAPVIDEDHLISRRKIVVTGRFTSPKGEVAMVKNEMVSVGETVEVSYKGDTYTWRLAAFEKGRISWEPVLP